ncbi:nesp102 [Neophasia sp. alphabaculovirus]|nr:nesp102 [Neophasia sp. alphabaculovirus]
MSSLINSKPFLSTAVRKSTVPLTITTIFPLTVGSRTCTTASLTTILPKHSYCCRKPLISMLAISAPVLSR